MDANTKHLPRDGRQMTHEDFTQWEKLPIYIVRRHFHWAFDRRGRNPFRRPLELDDLIQEANIGLMHAWKGWDPERSDSASFITYAYSVIRRTVGRYVAASARDSNCGIPLASEAEPHEWENAAGWDGPCDGVVDDLEFTRICMEKLRRRMPRKEYEVLHYRFIKGWTNKRLGKRLGVSYEYARRIVNETKIKAAILLMEEDGQE